MEIVAEHAVRITNPDKVLWPKMSYTKADLLHYLAQMTPYILPYMDGRPLTAIRCPDGVDKHRFYQKDAPSPTPDFVTTVDIPSVQSEKKVLHQVIVDSTSTLLWLGNLGCIEFHIPFNRYDKPLYPEWIAFDLDPTVPGFERVRTVAVCIHQLLERLAIPHVAKTSGATGVQIFVPLMTGSTYDDTRPFTKAVADFVVATIPEHATIERLTKNRGEKVYVDFLQHGAGRTLIAPYSPRATVHGTVSAPLLENELLGTAVPEDFTLSIMPKRMEKVGDLLKFPERFDLRPITKFLQQKGSL